MRHNFGRLALLFTLLFGACLMAVPAAAQEQNLPFNPAFAAYWKKHDGVLTRYGFSGRIFVPADKAQTDQCLAEAFGTTQLGQVFLEPSPRYSKDLLVTKIVVPSKRPDLQARGAKGIYYHLVELADKETLALIYFTRIVQNQEDILRHMFSCADKFAGDDMKASTNISGPKKPDMTYPSELDYIDLFFCTTPAKFRASQVANYNAAGSFFSFEPGKVQYNTRPSSTYSRSKTRTYRRALSGSTIELDGYNTLLSKIFAPRYLSKEKGCFSEEQIRELRKLGKVPPKLHP